MHCVYCKVIEYNIASQKIVENIGFKREGILRERIYKNGNYHNVIVWSILKDEFNE